MIYLQKEFLFFVTLDKTENSLCISFRVTETYASQTLRKTAEWKKIA